MLSFVFSTLYVVMAVGCVSLAAPVSSGGSNVQLIHQFPNETWVENIAVRPNNNLLVTTLTGPNLYNIDPERANPNPRLVHSFPNATSLFGIAEIAPDVFAVLASNYSLETGLVPHTSTIWAVDMSCPQPQISVIAAIPEAISLNGMCSLPLHPHILLIGDVGAGLIYRLDTHTKAVSIAVPASNPLVSLEKNPLLGTLGVNGLHVLHNELYATNSGRSTFGKIKIDVNGTVQSASQSRIIERASNGTYEDDFALDSEGNAYLVTGSGNSVIEIAKDGKQRVVAGDANSTEIAQPTSAALSRSPFKKRLFIVTAGDLGVSKLNHLPIIGGQVLSIDL